MQVTRIDCYCLLGEGPVWDIAEQAQFFLDIGKNRIHRYSSADGGLMSWDTPRGPGAMALRREGGAIVAMKDRVETLDFATGLYSPIAVAETQHPDALFNDGKVDRQGRFILGSCSTRRDDATPIGGIYRLDPDRSLHWLTGDIKSSNSPCFSPDGGTLYFSDSHRHTIFAFDYDIATGNIGPRRIFAQTAELGGMPDGATVDGEGLVWVAIIGGAKIAAFGPNGKLERTVDLPVALPGSVMFGGEALDRLFVPTIDPLYFGNRTHDGAGYLYVVDGLGARGLPEQRFAG